ncbi:MAG: hypothetical protein CFH01_01596 [Alphaproteobacteria bacterium MarineAlpha2_Bin1]|nr:MAG: hypothetical protein CFH01_01596 [Alphaproteobacteria bacterium MarineAlpha2_Bin1]|tara:strand:+ start:179 stop:649 length:471 start_codon:yes stop_codon:yes gene_type:complete
MKINISKNNLNIGKSLSRLVAVQLLYKKNFDDITFPKIIDEFNQFNNHLLYEHQRDDMDLIFLENLVNHISISLDTIDQLISEYLQNNSLDRLEIILAAILRLATCELLEFSEIPAKVIINEYVNLTYAFFDDQQPLLANGVIDGLARKIRENEFS